MNHEGDMRSLALILELMEQERLPLCGPLVQDDSSIIMSILHYLRAISLLVGTRQPTTHILGSTINRTTKQLRKVKL